MPFKIPKIVWPNKPTYWEEDGVLYISIPFTWNLPEVISPLKRGFRLHKKVVVGGPAVQIMPGYFSKLDFVEERSEYHGALQRVNPLATKTTTGCIRKCQFCAIGQGLIEPGGFKELSDWPDLPILTDNNLFVSSKEHFDKVVDRLIKWGWADFNQGVDCRLLDEYKAGRLAEIKKLTIRLALDSKAQKDDWGRAFDLLRSFKISKDKIRSYVLIGMDSGPEDAWERCEWIDKQGPLPLPMWFHKLDSLKVNQITKDQKALGWNYLEYRGIMAWYYHHKDLGIRKKYV